MHFDSEQAIHSFLVSFEDGTFPKSEWTHSSHLAMATYYLWRLSIREATSCIRNGIQRYNVAQGGINTPESGYHETLTIFWIQRIAEYVAALSEGTGMLEAVRGVVERFGKRRELYNDYYSFDVLNSMEARAKWVPPDLK